MSMCECGCGQPAPIATRHRRERDQVKGQPVRFIRGHAWRGRTASDVTRHKMSVVRKGRPLTPEWRAAITASKKRGDAHPQWKGDDVAYSTIHRWIARVATKTGVCSVCGAERLTQWANLSRKYRRSVDDFAEMCVPCHKRYDA